MCGMHAKHVLSKATTSKLCHHGIHTVRPYNIALRLETHTLHHSIHGVDGNVGMIRSHGTVLSARVHEAPGVSGGALLLGPHELPEGVTCIAPVQCADWVEGHVPPTVCSASCPAPVHCAEWIEDHVSPTACSASCPCGTAFAAGDIATPREP
jgi:hypothetical protein